MSEIQNPYSSPAAVPIEPISKVSPLARVLALLGVAFCGICIGSYISAELLYLHYPDEIRTGTRVAGHTVQAVNSSPLSMTVGIIPTLGFYGTHGFLTVPGALMATISCAVYYRRPNPIVLVIALLGFALWSHNNFLSLNALMSV